MSGRKVNLPRPRPRVKRLQRERARAGSIRPVDETTPDGEASSIYP